MDTNRGSNAFKQAEDALKEAAGKLIGNPNLQNPGVIDRTVGRMQPMGGRKDALRSGSNDR